MYICMVANDISQPMDTKDTVYAIICIIFSRHNSSKIVQEDMSCHCFLRNFTQIPFVNYDCFHHGTYLNAVTTTLD